MKPPLVLTALCGLLLSESLSAHPGHTDPHPVDQSQPKVVAVVFSDFQCVPCAEVSSQLERLVNEKKIGIQVVFKHAPAKPEAIPAHEAALAAGKQGKFWEMHDLLFKKPKANYSELLGMAKSLDLDVKQFQNVLDEREVHAEVLTGMAEAHGMGIRMTPTLFVNGRKLEGIEQIKSFVDAVLNQAAAPVASDPNKIYEFDLTGSPSTGPDDAPVTIVEYSDFRCGFCGSHSKNVTELMKAFPGKIRRVFKHYPIQVDDAGMLPHLGSMAAMKQDRFWEMYRALMNKPLTGREDLISRAVALGFDMETFTNDLFDAENIALLRRDIEAGDRAGIRSTPTSFINGKMLSGRRSVDELRQRVDAILNPGTVNEAATGSNRELGPVNAPVLIEFFADFSNPDSARMFAVLGDYMKKEKHLRVRFENYPAKGNPEAIRVHEAVMAAEAQGKLWEMIRLVFAEGQIPDRARILTFAKQLELDTAQFVDEQEGHIHLSAINADAEQGERRGLSGKPALLMGGTRMDYVPTLQELEMIVADACCGKGEDRVQDGTGK